MTPQLTTAHEQKVRRAQQGSRDDSLTAANLQGLARNVWPGRRRIWLALGSGRVGILLDERRGGWVRGADAKNYRAAVLDTDFPAKGTGGRSEKGGRITNEVETKSKAGSRRGEQKWLLRRYVSRGTVS